MTLPPKIVAATYIITVLVFEKDLIMCCNLTPDLNLFVVLTMARFYAKLVNHVLYCITDLCLYIYEMKLIR